MGGEGDPPLRPVLIVDDSDVVRRVLVKKLTALGLDVREESRAAGAKAMNGAELSCAVIDLELDDGNGADIAAALAASDPSLPMAFFTGGAALAVVERARTFGPVFAKPEEIGAVVAWVGTAARR